MGYAPVGGLSMYYEVHGSGEPLVLLHGAYMNIETMDPLLSGLAESRRVIAVELQGHGRTADTRYASSSSSRRPSPATARTPPCWRWPPRSPPRCSRGLRWSRSTSGSRSTRATSRRSFGSSRSSTRRSSRGQEDIRGIGAATLVVVGDSDAIRLEHAVEFFKLRGGGVMGDLEGMPAS
jgi:hypothetical protein